MSLLELKVIVKRPLFVFFEQTQTQTVSQSGSDVCRDLDTVAGVIMGSGLCNLRCATPVRTL